MNETKSETGNDTRAAEPGQDGGTTPPGTMKDRPLVAQLGTEESAYRSYLRMFVGRDSLWSLLRYELVTGLFGPLPGAAGYLLRKKTYGTILGAIGAGSVIGRNVTLRSPAQVRLGANVMIDDLCVLDAKGQGSEIVLGNQILVGRNTILSCTDGTIRMGDFISMGPSCYLVSKSHIEIGSNVSFGPGTQMLAGGHAFEDPDTPVIHQTRVHKGITVGDNVWFGANVTILDGVAIGQDAIVGAGSVVSKDVPEYAVVLGNPARVIQKRKQEAES